MQISALAALDMDYSLDTAGDNTVAIIFAPTSLPATLIYLLNLTSDTILEGDESLRIAVVPVLDENEDYIIVDSNPGPLTVTITDADDGKFNCGSMLDTMTVIRQYLNLEFSSSAACI